MCVFKFQLGYSGERNVKSISVWLSRVHPRLSSTASVCRDTEVLHLHWLSRGRPRVAAWWYRRGADFVALD